MHIGKKIDGLSVFSAIELIPLIEKYNISALIIAAKNIPSEVKTEVIDTCLQYNVKILSLPDVNSWINGELSVNQIREVRIEDLLERPPIQRILTK